MAADPAGEIEEDVEKVAEPGAIDDDKTPGDQPGARQLKEGHGPDEGGDDSDATSDPLVLAHMEPEKPAAKPATTTPATKQQPPATQDRAKQPPTPKPAEPAKAAESEIPDDEQTEREALADLPAEDWQKLGHKTKSQFLAQRKAIRSNAERLKAEAEARKVAESRYETVEGFVREQGLGAEEYAEAVAIGGLVKRADARAIPLLEERLARLRAAHGQPATPAAPPAAVAAPQLDEDLAAVLREAEEMGVDTAKVRARFKAATAAPAPAAPPAPAPAPAQPPALAGQARQAVPPSPGGDENEAIIEALVGLGVQPEAVLGHVSGLMAANPALKQVPPGQRLRAVLQAHRVSTSVPAPAARPTGQPLSGRGRPVMTGRGAAETTSDPLKLAVMRPGRR